MNRDALTLLLIGAGLYFLTRSSAGAAPGATFDYVPADELPLYGTPERLFPFDYASPTNLLPINYEA